MGNNYIYDINCKHITVRNTKQFKEGINDGKTT